MYNFSAAQVGLLQNATFTQDGEIKGIPVTGALTDEEGADNSNMLTITGDDGLVYRVLSLTFVFSRFIIRIYRVFLIYSCR